MCLFFNSNIVANSLCSSVVQIFSYTRSEKKAEENLNKTYNNVDGCIDACVPAPPAEDPAPPAEGGSPTDYETLKIA